MASIKGITLKKLVNTQGMEGYGLICDVYLNKKKVGQYLDYGDGEMSTIRFEKGMQELFMRILFEYNKENLGHWKDIYAKWPEMRIKDLERVRETYPYIPDEIMCPNGDDYDFLVNSIVALMDAEKAYKKFEKKFNGSLYYMVESEKAYYPFKKEVSPDEISSAVKEPVVTVYYGLDDFNVA